MDVPDLDHAGQHALERLVAAWTPLRALHVASIVKAVEEAVAAHPPGDTTWVGRLMPAPLDTARLRVGVQDAVDAGYALGIEEARRQNPALAERALAAPRTDHAQRIAAYCEGAERLLASQLVQTASREAFRLTATADVDIAGHAATVLGDTLTIAERDVLQGMATGGVNEGRYEVMEVLLGERHTGQLEAAEPHFLTGKVTNPDAAVYALEILDGNTCEECGAIDGQRYETLGEARVDYPGIGGGYVRCLGRERCRGSLVIIYPDEAAPTLDKPGTTGPLKGPGPKPKPPEPPKPPAPLPPPPPPPAPAALPIDQVLSTNDIGDIKVAWTTGNSAEAIAQELGLPLTAVNQVIETLKVVQKIAEKHNLPPLAAVEPAWKTSHPIGVVRIYDGDLEHPVRVIAYDDANQRVIVQAVNDDTQVFAAAPHNLAPPPIVQAAPALAASHPIGSEWFYPSTGQNVRVVGYSGQGLKVVIEDQPLLDYQGGYHFVAHPNDLTRRPAFVAPTGPVPSKPVVGRLPNEADVPDTMRFSEADRQTATPEAKALLDGVKQTIRDAANRLTPQQSTARTGPGAQISALYDYGGSAYQDMNQLLRGKLGYPPDAELQGRVDSLRAMYTEGNAVTLDRPVLVFRGMSIEEGANLIGVQRRDPAFMSTSIDHRTGDTFAQGAARPGREKVIMHLHLRSGQQVLPGLTHGHENEFILPPDTRYVVTGERARTSRGIRQFDAIVLLPGEGV